MTEPRPELTPAQQEATRFTEMLIDALEGNYVARRAVMPMFTDATDCDRLMIHN